MSNNARVQQLLDALFDSGRTPEEVCAGYPELLSEVRERWRQIRFVQADLDAMFPPAAEVGISANAPPLPSKALPQIPGYEVQAILGRGGMGIVFRARHVRLNRLVALKMVLAGEFAGPQERLRFQREAEAVAALRNPNIVQIHDIGDADGRPYFTMEYVEGGSLGQTLAGTPQPARQAATLLATLAEAVQAAHRCGIVHRDLKPGNVLLTADGIPKITDFGLARRLDGETALTRTGVAVGTPSYMAPEQARGRELEGPAVDVYALGAILYELLTGRPPFRAETAAETIQQVIARDPVPPSRLNATVPRDLETICLKCLRKEPGLRYVTAGALAEDAHRFLRGEAITARPEGRWERLVRRVRRRKAFSAAVALITLLAVALLGGGAWALSDREATARAVKAEDSATELAAEDDLKEMAAFLKASQWPEAGAALERAKGRRGERASDQLRSRLDGGARELKMALQLDAIRLRGCVTVDGRLVFAQSEVEFETAFRDYEYAKAFEDPETVAARIASSNIANSLVAALDHWSSITADARRQSWAMQVARAAVKRQSDPDPTGWRDRARDLDVWKNEAAFDKLVKETPFATQPVPLLLAVGQQLNVTGKNPLPFLKRIQEAHPGDFWANLVLGNTLLQTRQYQESLRYIQAALALRPDAAISSNLLGQALSKLDRKAEAIDRFRVALRIDPDPHTRRRLAVSLSEKGPFDEAIEQCRLAVVFFPKDAPLRIAYGRSLEALGRYDDAITQFSAAITLTPKKTETYAEGYMGLRLVYLRQGRTLDELRAWGEALESTPPLAHPFWYGHAERCLYYGLVENYHRNRRALLKTFGDTTDPYIAERTARACLLLPMPGAEVEKVAALANRAAAADRTKYPAGVFPHFSFVKGLADYRLQRYDDAIAVMEGEASRLGTNPRLILAMALYKKGKHAEARKKLAEAVLSADWRASKVTDHDGAIRHVLRRQAESVILPLKAFMEGNYQPRDNDERLALVGVCQFAMRHAALAKLYADAFDADSQLAEDFRVGLRYNAALAAAQAGCGKGDDAAKLGDLERAKLRRQAREWLRADLAGWKMLLDSHSAKTPTRDPVRQRLTQWQSDPDLACLRAPAELLKLPAEERNDCVALWDEIGRVVKASQVK